MLSINSTTLTRSTEGSSDGVSKIDYISAWSPNFDNTNSKYPVTLNERILLCYVILTQLPDIALDDITETVAETIQFYKKRDEYLSRKQASLNSSPVKLSIEQTRVRPSFHLPDDE